MTWFTGIMVYLVIWWVVLLTVLPWWVKVPDKPEPGHATSAPDKPMLWRKVAITSVISALLWLVAYYLIASDWITFREP